MNNCHPSCLKIVNWNQKLIPYVEQLQIWHGHGRLGRKCCFLMRRTQLCLVCPKVQGPAGPGRATSSTSGRLNHTQVLEHILRGTWQWTILQQLASENRLPGYQHSIIILPNALGVPLKSHPTLRRTTTSSPDRGEVSPGPPRWRSTAIARRSHPHSGREPCPL